MKIKLITTNTEEIKKNKFGVNMNIKEEIVEDNPNDKRLNEMIFLIGSIILSRPKTRRDPPHIVIAKKIANN